jgi:hypothetical protein
MKRLSNLRLILSVEASVEEHRLILLTHTNWFSDV